MGEFNAIYRGLPATVLKLRNQAVRRSTDLLEIGPSLRQDVVVNVDFQLPFRHLSLHFSVQLTTAV